MPPVITPRGYADGKRAAEAAARELVDASFGAAVLKPGGAWSVVAMRVRVCADVDVWCCARASPRAAIYGTRYAGSVPIPLFLAMAPASFVLRRLPGPFVGNAPVSVRNVAAAAVDAATQDAYRGRFSVLTNEELFTHTPRM